MRGLRGRMEFTEYSQGSRKISSCPAVCRQLANKSSKSRPSAPTRELLVMDGIRVLESGAVPFQQSMLLMQMQTLSDLSANF